MDFEINDFLIHIDDENISYTINDKTYSFDWSFLNLALAKSNNFQTYYNGYNLEIFRFIKYYLYPKYLYDKGIYYRDSLVYMGSNKNILRPYYIQTYSVLEDSSKN